MGSNASLRSMTHTDLESVLLWRNTPEVRNCMFSADEISQEQHTSWFERTAMNPKSHLMVMDIDGIACGFVNITQISDGMIADWSFLVASSAKKGSGYLLCNLALGYVFDELCMQKLNGQVLGFNTRSIGLHKRLGFRQEGYLRDNYYRDGKYFDVFLFGMTANEWKAK